MNTKNIATRLIAGAIVTTLVASVNSIAGAAQVTALGQKTIQYTDFNASSAQGAAALYNRIRGASEEVCSPLSHGDLSSKMQARSCTHKAIAAAVRQINQPALTAVYNARNDQPLPMTASAK